MKGLAGLLACLCTAVLAPSVVHAQDEATTDEAAAEETVAAPAPAAAPRARLPSDPPEDELAEVSSGPALADRQRAAMRGHPLDRPDYSADPSDPDLPVTMQLALGGGSTLTGSSYDAVLVSHDFAASGALYLGDVTILGRLLDWLHLGGRIGGRARTFARNDGPGGTASVVDLQVILQVRFQLGRVIDLGVHAGAGAGVAGVALLGDPALGVVPRVTAGVHLGFRVTHGVRIFLRASYDFCRWYQMDRFGDELELGGLAGLVGLEVRT
ncbi:MAG: hypothetical protein U0234_25750 [Sandaracinus sp.]